MHQANITHMLNIFIHSGNDYRLPCSNLQTPQNTNPVLHVYTFLIKTYHQKWQFENANNHLQQGTRLRCSSSLGLVTVIPMVEIKDGCAVIKVYKGHGTYLTLGHTRR